MGREDSLLHNRVQKSLLLILVHEGKVKLFRYAMQAPKGRGV
jgi:hypothetical protein